MVTIWELDFYSRPVLDEKEKKTWEVLICESALNTNTNIDSLFKYAKFCPNTEVNSVWLKNAIEEAIAQSQQTPQKIRFFRRQMNNMITKACQDAGINPQPSRRTFALNQWLAERMEKVYPNYPTYQPSTNPSVQLEAAPAKVLPDILTPQKWAFVTLTASALAEMSQWEIDFGEGFPLENLEAQTPIAGLVMYSSRALPLAGWMSGIEPAFIKFDSKQKRLLLETGANDSWILANLRNTQSLNEAANFEKTQQKAQGVHFLAIQSDPNAESFAGFWLLQELQLR